MIKGQTYAAGRMNYAPKSRPLVADVDEDSSRTKPSPGYRRNSMAALAFLFFVILAVGFGASPVRAKTNAAPKAPEVLKRILSRTRSSTQNLTMNLTTNSKLMKKKTNPALAPPTWRARCRVSDHGHRE